MHCESKVPCLRTQHNVSGQGSRRMARCGDEHNNHEATAPPTKGSSKNNNSTQNQNLNFIFGMSGISRVISLILTSSFLTVVCKRTRNLLSAPVKIVQETGGRVKIGHLTKFKDALTKKEERPSYGP